MKIENAQLISFEDDDDDDDDDVVVCEHESCDASVHK